MTSNIFVANDDVYCPYHLVAKPIRLKIGVDLKIHRVINILNFCLIRKEVLEVMITNMFSVVDDVRWLLLMS